MSSLIFTDDMTSSLFNQSERSCSSFDFDFDFEPLPIDEVAKHSQMKMTCGNGTFALESTATLVRSAFLDHTPSNTNDNVVPLTSIPASSILSEACNLIFGDVDNNIENLRVCNGQDFPQKGRGSIPADISKGTEEVRSSNVSSKANAGCTIPSSVNVKPSVVGRSWYERYHELMVFQKEYGHCCVPVHWPQNPQLAQWVKRQRSQYKLRKDGKHSNMSNSRLEALEQIQFVWDSHSALWEKRLGELKNFKESHGHCNVPTQYPPNQELAVWAKSQRRQFKLYCQGGETKCHISVDRIQKLLNIGFVFNPTGRDFLKSKPKKKTMW